VKRQELFLWCSLFVYVNQHKVLFTQLRPSRTVNGWIASLSSRVLGCPLQPPYVYSLPFTLSYLISMLCLHIQGHNSIQILINFI
jgi:hypothetical protein